MNYDEKYIEYIQNLKQHFGLSYDLFDIISSSKIPNGLVMEELKFEKGEAYISVLIAYKNL